MGEENLTERERVMRNGMRPGRGRNGKQERLAEGLIQACLKKRDGLRQEEEKKCCLRHNR